MLYAYTCNGLRTTDNWQREYLRRAANRSLNLEPVFFYLGLKGWTGKPQQLGGPRSIALRQVEGFANENAGSVIHQGVKKTFTMTLGQLLSKILSEGFTH